MLVAMALTIFIMVILSEAFVTGLETFRQLKAIGDMDASLRTAATLLRRDLAADHFEGKRRLSDTNFFSTTLDKGPPHQGFFRLVQGPVQAGENEGNDLDGIASRRRTTHALAFTVKLRGNRREEFFSARVPYDPTDPSKSSPLLTIGQPDSRFQDAPGTYNFQWAEVAYFLVPTGQTAEGTPLFSLHRRQRLLIPDEEAFELNWGSKVVPFAQYAAYTQISCMKHPKDPNRLYFNTPRDITIPERRFGMNETPGSRGLDRDSTGAFRNHRPYAALGNGDDLLLTNVLSFDVQYLTATTGNFVDLGTTTAQPTWKYFDTWSRVQDDTYDYGSVAVPRSLRILALQVTLRVWDLKTRQSRQVTIVQDM
jgi:hypothetical protein